jgi:hypothetical protein
MSTTTNLIAATTLTAAAFVGGALLIPTDDAVAPEAGVVDAGPQPLVGAFYLRFPDEQAWQAAVRSSPFWQWEQALVDAGPDGGMVPVSIDAGSFAMASSGHAIDVVGTIVLPGPDGGSEVLDGWHVNFQGVLPDQWRQYLVEPRSPVRTWAR